MRESVYMLTNRANNQLISTVKVTKSSNLFLIILPGDWLYFVTNLLLRKQAATMNKKTNNTNITEENIAIVLIDVFSQFWVPDLKKKYHVIIMLIGVLEIYYFLLVFLLNFL